MRRPPSPFAVQPESNWRDVRVLRDQDLAATDGPVIPDLLAVWVRRGNRWHGSVLTGWRKLGPGDWAARLQSTPSEVVWVQYKGVALQPVMPQSDPPPGALTEDRR